MKNNKFKIKDVISITNDQLGFQLNESDCHDVLNYLHFVMGDFYKIVRYRDGDHLIQTLFHSYPHPYAPDQKIKHLITNDWISCDSKEVIDGSGGRKYVSGWHIIPTFSEAREYLNNFKHKENLAILKVKAKGLWKKEHSRSNVWLADEIFIETPMNITMA